MKGRTYRYFTGEPLYPFGYGLSYSSFRYANARATVAADGSVRVSADVTNVGNMASDEVVQLYLSHVGVELAALRELKGFKRIHLESQATKTVEFELGPRDVSVVDSAGRHRIAPGEVAVWVGGGQPHARTGLKDLPGAGTSFRLVNSATLPD
jgi:beta-glucosidase